MATLETVRWGPAAGGSAQQLVVLCHGVGADGHDLIDLAPHWAEALPHAAFAAPDGPEPYDGAPMGRQWFSLADRSPARMEAGVSFARPALDIFLDAELARLRLPPDAYALMGFSQGAMVALYTGLRRPTGPKAILAYSGALIAPGRLATERTNAAPVLLVHGEADPVVSPELSRQAETALRAEGVPVETVFSPKLGHGIDPAGLSAGALFLQRAFSGV
ncbi:MAG: prolyl oligopeptidase family serine peptidase [Acetobacteraceae bacterium]